MTAALTIRQPWADCIIWHGKDIENRSWSTSYRGPLIIHAGKAWGRDEKQTQLNLAEDLELSDIGVPLLGGIIGVVDLVDIVTRSDSQWFDGPFGWVLESPRELDFVECKGQLGLFDLSHPQIAAE